MISRMDDNCQGFCYACEIFTTGRIVTASSTVRASSRGVAQMNSIVQANCGHTGIIVSSAKNRANSLNIAIIGDSFNGVYTGNIVLGDERVRSQ